MASSSVSQDDIDNDFEKCSRRSKIRTARAHKITPPSKIDSGMIGDDEGGDTSHGGDVGCVNASDHDVSPKPAAASRVKDKRVNRTNHMNKGKAQRDRRKLREKRRSTGVVHLPSTESTGGSTGEDEDEDCGAAETRKNTQHNEFASDSMHSKHGQDAVREHLKLQHTSASDLEADDEENGASGSRSSANNDEDSPARENGAVPVVPPVDPRRSDDVFMLLERSLEENQKLSQMLEARDKEVAALSASLQQLKARMGQTIDESSRLREENAALIKAVGSLSNND